MNNCGMEYGPVASEATGGKEYLKKGMSKGKAVEVAYVY